MRMRRGFSILTSLVAVFSFLLLFALTTLQAGAAASPPGQTAPAANKTPVMLKDVTVTATRTERQVFDVPSSAAVVGKEQMEREPQPTIAQQLQDIPGIQVSDGGMGGGTKRVSIRGESPSRVLVLIDGMKISEQKSMDGSMIMIDPLNVERIEVIKGPASVLYGSEAIGGVVNIITKKGGTRPIQATLALTGDSSTDSVTPYASFYGSYQGFNYRLSGDYIDAKDKRGGSGRIADTDYLQRNLSAYLDYSWDKGKIGAGYDHFWSNISIPGSVADGAAVEMHLPKWLRDRYYLFGELDRISGVLKKARLTGFFQETKKDFWNDINVISRAPMSLPPGAYREVTVWQHPFTKNEQKSYGLNLQTDWTLGEDHYLILGADYLYDDLDAKDHRQGSGSMRMYSPGGTPMGPAVSMFSSDDLYKYEGHQQSIAVFAQDEWTFHKDWTATIGLRQTWLQSALDSTDDPTLKERESDDSHMVGSLGLVYSGFKDWRLRAQYAQGYRYPLLNQLYIGTTHGSNGQLRPNPELKPEKSQNFELGARYDNGSLAADLALYYNYADDYITNRSIPGSEDTIFDNVDKARTYGAELTLSYTFESWNLTPYLSGAYMRRTFEWGDGGGKTSNTGDPRWTGRAGIRHEHRFSPAFAVFTDVYGRFAARAEEDLSDGSKESRGGWGTANLAVGARLGEDQNWFIDLNLNNLSDKRYTLAAGNLEDPGFHAVLRVGVEF
jgi:hemoglobin/transferrin/lactoferrin receptor protein